MIVFYKQVCVEACPTLTSITTCTANDGTALTGAKWNAKVVSATPSKICPDIISDLFPTFDKTNAAKVTKYSATNYIVDYNTIPSILFQKFSV